MKSGTVVENWGMIGLAAIAILAIVVGYFIGYRSGHVTGELAALKE